MLRYYANSFLTNYSGILVPRNNWTGTVIFTDSCRYETIDPENQIDYIKLFGIRKSPLPNNLKKNGAYLTWAYVSQVDKIRIAWYLHTDDKQVISMPIAVAPLVDLKVPVVLDIANYENSFVFNLNGSIVNIDKNKYNIDSFKNGWSLQPWGGGSEPVSHERRIEL